MALPPFEQQENIETVVKKQQVSVMSYVNHVGSRD